MAGKFAKHQLEKIAKYLCTVSHSIQCDDDRWKQTVGDVQNKNGIGTVLPKASIRIIGLSCAENPPSHAQSSSLGTSV